MNNIQKKKEDRFKFLHFVYETVEGRKGYVVDGWEIGRELGFDKEYSTDIFYYLKDEQLIEPMGAGIRLSLTHYGVMEVEEALSKPNEPTTYFPPVINMIQIKEMYGGAIQQGTNNSTISIVSNDTINYINQYVETLNKFATNNIENVELKRELKADVETLKKQLQSPKPKNSIIKATLLSTKDVLVGAMGGLIGTLAHPKAQELIQMAEKLIIEIT